MFSLCTQAALQSAQAPPDQAAAGDLPASLDKTVSERAYNELLHSSLVVARGQQTGPSRWLEKICLAPAGAAGLSMVLAVTTMPLMLAATALMSSKQCGVKCQKRE